MRLHSLCYDANTIWSGWFACKSIRTVRATPRDDKTVMSLRTKRENERILHGKSNEGGADFRLLKALALSCFSS